MMPTTETKSKTKLKKAKSMSYSEDQVQEMLENARKEEAEKTRAEIEAAEPNYFSDEDMDDSPSLFGSDSISKAPVMDIQGEDMDDIFTYCDKHYHSKGKLVSYVMKKDGHFVGEQYHPFSWSKVQEKFGGGNFTIMAKDANTKTYIKQQTQLVQELIKPREEERERVIVQPAPQPQTPQFDPNLLLDFMAKMQLSQKSEEKTVAREEAKSTTTIITAMMDAQQKAQDKQMDMMFKMQDQTSKMIQAMSDNTTKLVESMRREFMDVIKSKPKEEFGFKELMLLQSNSRNEGFEQMKMIMEIAESKAEEKAEILAGQDNDTGTIGKLIGAVVPLITATTKQMTPPQPQRRLAPQPRRPLPPPQAFTRSAPAGAFAPQAQSTQNETRRAEVRENNEAPQNSANSFSVFAPVGVTNEEPEVQNAIETLPAPANDGEMTLDELFATATPVQQRVAQEIIPIIADSLSGDPKQAAVRANVVLNSVGAELQMSKEALLKEFTFDMVWNIAKAFGIRDDKSQQWFKEFYAATENSTNGPS